MFVGGSPTFAFGCHRLEIPMNVCLTIADVRKSEQVRNENRKAQDRSLEDR